MLIYPFFSGSQEIPATPGQPVTEPMFIPVAMGLLNSSGKDMPLSSVSHDGKLESVACNGQPVYTTVLKMTKVSSKPLQSPLRRTTQITVGILLVTSLDVKMWDIFALSCFEPKETILVVSCLYVVYLSRNSLLPVCETSLVKVLLSVSSL